MTTTRQRTCRKLTRMQNRCPNPEIPDTGLCLRHLTQAAEDYSRILTDAHTAQKAGTTP